MRSGTINTATPTATPVACAARAPFSLPSKAGIQPRLCSISSRRDDEATAQGYPLGVDQQSIHVEDGGGASKLAGRSGHASALVFIAESA